MVLSRGRNKGCTWANAIPARVRKSEKASTAVIPLGHIFQSFTAVLIKLSMIYYLRFVLNSLALRFFTIGKLIYLATYSV